MKSKTLMRMLCVAVGLPAIVLSALSLADGTGQWAHWKINPTFYEEMVLLYDNHNSFNFARNVYPLTAIASYNSPAGIVVSINSTDTVQDELDAGLGPPAGISGFPYVYASSELDAPGYGQINGDDPRYWAIEYYVTLQTWAELTCPSSSYTSGINNTVDLEGENVQAEVAIPYCPLDGGFPVYAYGFFVHGI